MFKNNISQINAIYLIALLDIEWLIGKLRFGYQTLTSV